MSFSPGDMEAIDRLMTAPWRHGRGMPVRVWLVFTRVGPGGTASCDVWGVQGGERL